MTPTTSTCHRSGFTLIELLVVIAIIGILAGILIPTLAAVNVAAKKTSSKVFFSQVELALLMYKTDYGYYPTQLQTSSNTDSAIIDLSDLDTSIKFIQATTGRNPDGTNLEAATQTLLNKRARSFISYSQTDFYIPESTNTPSNNQLADKFNNPNITVLLDSDGNGFITPPGNSTSYRRETGISVLGNPSEGTYTYSTFN